MPRLFGRPTREARFASAERAVNPKKTIGRILKIYFKEGKSLSVAVVCIFLSALFALASPYFLGRTIDAFEVSTGLVNGEALSAALVILTCTYLLCAGLNITQGAILAGVSQQLVAAMRKELFSRLQRLPLKFFDTHSHGDIMSRLTNDADNISTIISQATTQLATAIITVIGSLIIMLIINPILTLAAVLTVPMVALLTKFVTRRTRRYFREQQEELGQLDGLIEETINGLKMVKAFNRQDHIKNNFNGMNASLRTTATRAQIWAGFLMPFANVITNIGFACIACVGGVLVVNKLTTVGIITSFISYSRQMVRPLNDIAGVFNTLQTAIAGAERVFSIADEIEETPDLPDAIPLSRPKGDVEFRNVSFSYTNGTKVLKNISFKVKSGQKVAFVGSTGAGKTTIVNLLARFYDVDDGEILIDGIDIRKYTRSSLRECFSVVLQDTHLFTGTVRENIQYSKPDATEEEVRSAAMTANAHGFIMSLPKGYDTILSGNSDILSEGQRQLLSIARAVLRNTAFLVLDEATSSVDTRTEFRIKDAMEHLMARRTTFFIAHRLSTIKNSDIIIVIKNGEIEEIGDHMSLIERKGSYYKMQQSQHQVDDSEMEEI
jgi:ATP-binding cassette subfamily B protein